MPRSLRSLTISFLALWKGLSQKQIGRGAGLSQKKVSYHLREGNLEDDVLFGRLLQGVEARPAEVRIVIACLENLAALEENPEMGIEERDVVEAGILEGARFLREVFSEAVRRSRAVPPLDVYPEPGDLEAARWQAGELWQILEPLPEDDRLARVRERPDFWSWALVEKVCEESVVQASRRVERAASLADLAQEIAERMQGPESWRNRIQGFATAHAANALRVAGELREAEALLERAKELWWSGEDPDEVLDPGRLLDLEASLRRGQRRFEEALVLLEEALKVGRCPERYLVNKGLTLEIMGKYEQAVEALLQAEPLVERQGDARLMNILRFNLAWDLCHLRRFGEACEMAQEVRAVALEMGDELGVLRALWLTGRISAGLGRIEEARSLLRQARREFAARKMEYDVALALLEEAALLLEQGRMAEVRDISRGLTEVFESKGVHREALAALQLFQKAVACEEATAELARRILGFLFRARYDEGLRFTVS